MVERLEDRTLLSAGDLDLTFDTDGTATADFGGVGPGDTAHAVAIQADGKIVAGGISVRTLHPGGLPNDADFAIARFQGNGSLDSSFGSGGKVMTNFPKFPGGYSSYDVIRGLAIQSNGKIVAVGTTGVGIAQAPSDFALARYNPNGSLDGKAVRTDFSVIDRASAVAIQPTDEKIVVVGQTTPGCIGCDGSFAVARYLTTNMKLDTSFDGDGKATIMLGRNSAATGVAVQSDGKIVVAGWADLINNAGGTGTEDFAIVRYNSNGSVDTSFGSGGQVITDIGGGDIAHAVAIQSDGKILVAGVRTVLVASRMVVARYNSDGTLDATFGAGGVVATLPGSAAAISIQSDGKILLAGSALVRLNSDGTIDSGFGPSLVTIEDTSVSEGNAGNTDAVFTVERHMGAALAAVSALDAALQSDGKLVTAGGANGDFVVARYQTAPPSTPPASATVDFATADGTATAGSDYVAASSVAMFGPGETTTTITIQVIGDTTLEPTETFFVNLNNASGAVLYDSQGVGRITNDDTSSIAAAIVAGDARIMRGRAADSWELADTLWIDRGADLESRELDAIDDAIASLLRRSRRLRPWMAEVLP